MRSITQYFNDLNVAVGAAWNRFWFTPTRATTLGAVRVGAGLLALFAVATYAPDLERWFASDGMLPMSLIRDLYRPEGQLLGQRSVLDALPDRRGNEALVVAAPPDHQHRARIVERCVEARAQGCRQPALGQGNDLGAHHSGAGALAQVPGALGRAEQRIERAAEEPRFRAELERALVRA